MQRESLAGQDYLTTLIDRRFANPQILDAVRRVAYDGCSRRTGLGCRKSATPWLPLRLSKNWR